MIISSRWQPSAWGMGQRSTLAIAVGGDFHLVLEVFQNLQVEQQGNDPFINDICYSSGIKRPVGVFASFSCLHLTCVHHRGFLIPMSHVSKADVVGDEAVLFVTKILRGKATASPSLVVRTSLTYIYQNKRFFPRTTNPVAW
jgi:hypothetical protein